MLDRIDAAPDRATRLELLDQLDRHRPKTRGECPTERPCPWVSCRYHLAARVQQNGTLLFNDDDYRGSHSRSLNARKVSGGRREVARRILWAVERLWELPETCALDVAEAGEKTWPEVAEILGVDKERVRQIGDAAYAKAKELLAQMEPDQEDED